MYFNYTNKQISLIFIKEYPKTTQLIHLKAELFSFSRQDSVPLWKEMTKSP